jgi:hypothetical protein
MGLLLAVLVGLAGCMDFDPPWAVRVGVPTQPLAPIDLGVSNAAIVAPGDAWISIRSWDGTDVTYPVVSDGAGLRLQSTFDPARPDSHATLMLLTRLSKNAEPAEEHPDVQYATVMVEAIVAPTLRDIAPASQSTMMTIELDINVPRTCGEPPPSVAGTVEGCLVGTDCPSTALARRDGVYQAGPLGINFEVLRQECVE